MERRGCAENLNTRQAKVGTFADIHYVCSATSLISESLNNGCDVAQLSNGDLIVTEIKVVHTSYTWDPIKRKMIKTQHFME